MKRRDFIKKSSSIVIGATVIPQTDDMQANGKSIYFRKHSSLQNNCPIFPYPMQCERMGEPFPVSAISFVFTNQNDLYFAHHAKKIVSGLLLPIAFQKDFAPKTSGYTVFLKHDLKGESEESYTLTVNKDSAVIDGAGDKGVLYGLMSFVQLLNDTVDGGVTLLPVQVADTPFKQWRGVHVYLPGRKYIPDFIRLIDTLAFLKMNSMIIEVGGGMQFEKHPEINTAWEQFCINMMNFPGGPRKLQGTEAYWKNSTHPENGDGSYITKEETRYIVEYARSLCIDVIPEIQGLSHAYFLTMPHREISEHPHEPFPEAPCPMNPAYYDLYFDVAREVIEVFRPRTVNIGHDEIRVLGWCPRCKGKPGEELLSYEINQLTGFYHSLGIEVFMWGEKLMDLTSYKGEKMGGVKLSRTDERGRVYHLPETWRAINLISKDIFILDWYHTMADDTSSIFHHNGFKKIALGNLRADQLKNVAKRLSVPGVVGGEASSWVLSCEDSLARDGVLTAITWCAGALWSDQYENDAFRQNNRDVVNILPSIRNTMRGCRHPVTGAAYLPKSFRVFYRGGDAPSMTMPTPKDFYLGEKIYRGFYPVRTAPSGTSFMHPGIEAIVNENVGSLVFLTACEKSVTHFRTNQYENTEGYIISMIYMFYEDGSIEPMVIRAGETTGPFSMDWGRKFPEDGRRVVAEIDEGDANATTQREPPLYVFDDNTRPTLSYLTNPVVYTAADGQEVSLYAYEWMNPHPEKKVLAVRHVKCNTTKPEQTAYLFALGGVII